MFHAPLQATHLFNTHSTLHTIHDTQRHAGARRGTQRHAGARRGTQRHAEARRDTQRHAETRRGTQRHAETRRDTQRHARRRATSRNMHTQQHHHSPNFFLITMMRLPRGDFLTPQSHLMNKVRYSSPPFLCLLSISHTIHAEWMHSRVGEQPLQHM